VQERAAPRNSGRAYSLPLQVRHIMGSLFMAGPDLIRSDITALGARGPYRLTISHRQGTIVEYFHTAKAAMTRQAEIEELLMPARGEGRTRISRTQKGVAA
jgi:hypothetical protein